MDIPDIPPEVIQDLKEKLDSGKLNGMYLTRSEPGSIVVFGVLAGLAGAFSGAAFWLLNKTLGQDISATWPKTNISQKFRKLLEYGSSDQVDKLISIIKTKIETTIPLNIEGIVLDFNRGPHGEDQIIVMTVTFTNKYPGTRGKLVFTDDSLNENLFKKGFGYDDEGSTGPLLNT